MGGGGGHRLWLDLRNEAVEVVVAAVVVELWDC